MGMAFTVTQLVNQRQVSVHGRKLGIDRNLFLVGPSGLREPNEDIGTTVPTTLSIAGVSVVTTMSSTQGPVQHNLPAPVAGVTKRIVMASSSTASIQFLSTPNGASIISPNLGTTVGVLNFAGPGGSIALYAPSTSKWVVTANPGSTAGGAVTFSTST